jgi:multisubunit Na+/H+ antiporter MnhC subunit
MVRGWMVLAREAVLGVVERSRRRKPMPRRARSQARVRPAGPAPMIRTSVVVGFAVVGVGSFMALITYLRYHV